MTDGAKRNGAMDTTGMNTTKGNVKRDKDGAPAPAKKDDARRVNSALTVRRASRPCVAPIKPGNSHVRIV